jgi:N-acyl-D-amino-acid deacylase
MAYDLLIRNGTVIDGAGALRYQADIAVKDGRIAEIGKIKEGASKVIDAHGCIVAPGFIDPHTHYDAQICWDPAISPSSWHGVTSVVMGNCGVGIAPCRPEAREIATRDLVNVEAIPFEVLNQGITWDWVTFPEFLAAADKRGSALNLGFIAPLTPFRHYVMGEASLERATSGEETAPIKTLLREAIDAGAFGWSTTVLNQHVGYEARPLACRNASRDELKAYCNVLNEAGKGAIEIALTQTVGVLAEEEEDLLALLLKESGRNVTFLALFQRDDLPEACPETRRRARLSRRRAADLAARADPRRQYAQPVLLWRLSVLEPGLRGQIESGAARRLCRPGLPQCVPNRDQGQHRLAPVDRPRDAQAGVEAL